MTDEEEFAARSQLKWTREGDERILLYRRRRMGRVVPNKDHSGMWQSVKVDGILSGSLGAVTQPPQKNARVTKLLFETPVLLGILRGRLQVRRRPPLWPEPARRPWPSSDSRCR